ncbi:MAG TPA: carbohydrate ABC transporter permease [Methylomirabilota bacterium]|jgi:ABC-type glycerol-3-phosphate transport system permease component|nr:carbohydrate ABC transporter permease [Methylomirabilota bacterium]
MRRLQGPLWRAFVYAAALGLAAQAVFPLLWMLSTSLKPPREVFATPPTLVPAAPTLANFVRLFEETAFLTYFLNSILVSGLTVLLTMAVGASGAYSLTRFAFPGRETVAKLILCTYMFAPIMIVIPIYILARRLGIVNTHLALVLSYSSFCLPFSLWLLRAFFRGIPVELEEAAQVDGAGRARAVWHVVVPLALPGVIATSIFTFTLAWNDYIFTRILVASDELKTLPVGVQDLFSAAVVDWGLIMAAGMLITIPALAFFMAVQRHLVAGWGSGGLKG